MAQELGEARNREVLRSGVLMVSFSVITDIFGIAVMKVVRGGYDS